MADVAQAALLVEEAVWELAHKQSRAKGRRRALLRRRRALTARPSAASPPTDRTVLDFFEPIVRYQGGIAAGRRLIAISLKSNGTMCISAIRMEDFGTQSNRVARHARSESLTVPQRAVIVSRHATTREVTSWRSPVFRPGEGANLRHATRHGALTEFHISFEDWGKLPGIIIREAARDLGVSKGRILLALPARRECRRPPVAGSQGARAKAAKAPRARSCIGAGDAGPQVRLRAPRLARGRFSERSYGLPGTCAPGTTRNVIPLELARNHARTCANTPRQREGPATAEP